MPPPAEPNAARLLDDLQRWSQELGFAALGVTGIDLTQTRLTSQNG